MNDAVAQAIGQREEEFMRAVQERDMDFLEDALGPEFTLTTGRPGSEVRSRDEWLAITRDRYAITSFAFEEMDVLVYDHVGLVRSRYWQEGSMDEQDRTMSYLMTDVWVWRETRWQLVTRHISPLQG